MALQTMGSSTLNIFLSHTYRSQHVHFYRMLTILNLIPYGLPKVLTFSPT
jgi:hypothetical protein